jgi:hypothetical protein
MGAEKNERVRKQTLTNEKKLILYLKKIEKDAKLRNHKR